MSDPESQPQPIALDAETVLSRHRARTRRALTDWAGREADYLDEISHLEAYIATLTARVAELEAAVNAAPGDAWGDPAAKEN